MAKLKMQFSTKRLLIERANSTIVVIVGVAAFVTAFSLVASRSLLAKRSYQAKVIAAQEKARDQLHHNIEAVDTLKTSYQEFVSRPENIIGGNSTGQGERDGDNAKIILDALPSKYDFPALAASLEKILADRNYRIRSITGTDNEATQNDDGQAAAAAPQTNSTAPVPNNAAQQQVTQTATSTETAAVDMQFELSAEGAYGSMIELLSVFQNSIRPLYVQKLSFSAQDGGVVELTINGNSYYQPEKSLNIKSEVVK